ncbi:MAG: hypothetical protein ABI806_15145, partial [Candidatus Solibacter sp.]
HVKSKKCPNSRHRLQSVHYFFFSSDRDPVPQESDIQVGTPNFGSTQRITAKYAAGIKINVNQSGILFT